MAQPPRQEALTTLRDLRAHVLELLARVPGSEHTRPGIGGGDWSVKDLLGHLAFWEELALEAIGAWGRGERPRAETYFAGQAAAIDAANAEDQARKRPWDYEEVRTAADDTHARLLMAIESMSDEDWRAKAPYPTERRDRMGSMLGSILGAPQLPFGHASAHLPDLEAFLSERLA
ncbi:MAG: DinB family protein [Actinobacteria bacterium]|nr:DinB family protein [Actinomycetota bacterium]